MTLKKEQEQEQGRVTMVEVGREEAEVAVTVMVATKVREESTGVR